MRAWILLVVCALSLCTCSKPRVPPQEATSRPPDAAARLAPDGIVYLLRRVVAATEERLQGFPAGSEARLIEQRSEKLLVEIQGMQFEIDRENATNNLDQRDRTLARDAERHAARPITITASQAEDRTFLKEENARRRSFAKARIERLRSAILSAREEVAILEADYDDTPNNEARQQRVAALQTSIANCDKEIQILSDAMADEN